MSLKSRCGRLEDSDSDSDDERMTINRNPVDEKFPNQAQLGLSIVWMLSRLSTGDICVEDAQAAVNNDMENEKQKMVKDHEKWLANDHEYIKKLEYRVAKLEDKDL